jgi:hypothetical protein
MHNNHFEEKFHSLDFGKMQKIAALEEKIIKTGKGKKEIPRFVKIIT